MCNAAGFESGQVVAVKVRHPNVATTILRDFSLMMWVAHLASQVPQLSHLRLEDTLKQFAAPLKEQVCGCVAVQLLEFCAFRLFITGDLVSQENHLDSPVSGGHHWT